MLVQERKRTASPWMAGEPPPPPPGHPSVQGVLLICPTSILSIYTRVERATVWIKYLARSPLLGACNSHNTVNATAFLQTSLFLDTFPAK